MNKILLFAIVLAVSGCNPFASDPPDKLSLRPALTPQEVIELQEICKSQPNYENSWVQKRGTEAKGVVCRYTDINNKSGGTPSTYTIDADILKIKIQERVK